MAQATSIENKPRLATATLTFGDVSVDVLLEEFTFKSGNTGWRSTIDRFAVGNHIYGGQIQVYRMDRKKDKVAVPAE